MNEPSFMARGRATATDASRETTIDAVILMTAVLMVLDDGKVWIVIQ